MVLKKKSTTLWETTFSGFASHTHTHTNIQNTQSHSKLVMTVFFLLPECQTCQFHGSLQYTEHIIHRSVQSTTKHNFTRTRTFPSLAIHLPHIPTTLDTPVTCQNEEQDKTSVVSIEYLCWGHSPNVMCKKKKKSCDFCKYDFDARNETQCIQLCVYTCQHS